jgi:hypothetical protein
VIEPTSRRGVSVLRQRADAAQRAFSRADALVSIAQGYLRGDRPDRSPIDLTLTIPESSLRADAIWLRLARGAPRMAHRAYHLLGGDPDSLLT